VPDLPRSARLLTGAEFKRVFEARRRHANTAFRIHFAESETPRLGIAVSRRVSSKAVVRNRIRRQIRESFRLNRPSLATMDYVVLAQPYAATLDRAQMRTALENLWQRFSVTA
jgi:ribonuclease P protein component